MERVHLHFNNLISCFSLLQNSNLEYCERYAVTKVALQGALTDGIIKWIAHW